MAQVPSYFPGNLNPLQLQDWITYYFILDLIQVKWFTRLKPIKQLLPSIRLIVQIVTLRITQ
jgi:hypothetical protein